MKSNRWIYIVLFAFAFGIIVSAEPTPVPLVSWEKATPLDGGKGLLTTKLVPAMNHWYSSTSTTLPMYYSVNVIKGSTYEIYWDDKTEGSVKYKGDVVLWVFKMDAKTKYDSKDSGYKAPIVIKATETTINIVVTSMSPGTFAFGIRKM